MNDMQKLMVQHSPRSPLMSLPFLFPFKQLPLRSPVNQKCKQRKEISEWVLEVQEERDEPNETQEFSSRFI